MTVGDVLDAIRHASRAGRARPERRLGPWTVRVETAQGRTVSAFGGGEGSGSGTIPLDEARRIAVRVATECFPALARVLLVHEEYVPHGEGWNEYRFGWREFLAADLVGPSFVDVGINAETTRLFGYHARDEIVSIDTTPLVSVGRAIDAGRSVAPRAQSLRSDFRMVGSRPDGQRLIWVVEHGGANGRSMVYVDAVDGSVLVRGAC